MGNDQKVHSEEQPLSPKEQYEMLLRCSGKKDLTEWNEWRNSNPSITVSCTATDIGKHADFKNAYLKGANLKKANLEEADFEDANIDNASFKGAILLNTNFKNAKINDAEFAHTDLKSVCLEGAELTRTNCEGADFSGLDLNKVKFGHANLKSAILKNANLTGAFFHNASLIETNFEQANLTGAKFENAVLEDAILTKAILWEADLRGANLHRANLREALLAYAHLEYAWLLEADLKDAFLADAYLEGALLYKACLRNANLERSRLKDANLAKADLRGANLSYSNLEGAILRNSLLQGTNLSRANLGDSDMSSIYFGSFEFNNKKIFKVKVKHKDLFDNQKDVLEKWQPLKKARVSFGYGRIDTSENIERASRIQLFDVLSSDDTDGSTVKGKRDTIFTNTFLGNAIFSLSDECKQESKGAIQALSEAIVNNVQFADTVFGRNVRDAAWLQNYRKNCSGSFWKQIIRVLWWGTSNYGRSIIRWALVSFVIALIFGCFYSYHCPKEGIESYFNFNGYPEDNISVVAPFYYSIVTFTTLGFGDITPKMGCWWAQLVVTIEVVIGYIMLGGLISIFANKLARRND